HPPAVQEADVGVAEEAEDPQGVGRPPVEVVAVEDDRRVAPDPLLGHEPGEPFAVEVVPRHLVVELRVPVDLDRPGDVAGVVEQHVLVGLDDHDVGVVEVVGQPAGRDELLGVGVLRQLGGRVVLDGHEGLLIAGGGWRQPGYDTWASATLLLPRSFSASSISSPVPRRTCGSRRSWSTPARFRRCPSTWRATGTRWSRWSSARRRSSSPPRSTASGGCTSGSTCRPRPPRPGGSPGSSGRAWKVPPPRRCWPPPTISTKSSGWPTCSRASGCGGCRRSCSG